MYDWHNGQTSPFYAAASSGLVASWDSLIYECNAVTGPDKEKLMQWLLKRQTKFKMQVVVRNQAYYILPWVSRSY